jgi:simple sugar transport system ATP-binding protein
VGSIEFLHRRIVAERDQGTPVMIISTELDEVMELADRIAVLYKGKLVGIVPAGTGRDVLGLMMAGIPPEEHAHTLPATRQVTGQASAAASAAATSDAEGGDHV